MTNRPQPRRSALAGQTPITPSPETPVKPDMPATPEMPATPGIREGAQHEHKQKITITINTEVANHARGIYLQQLAEGGPQTWSQWIEEAIRQQLDRKRASSASIPPGQIPTGRPVNLDKR